jgi:hypothetical protein
MIFNEKYDIAIDGTVTNIRSGRILKTCLAGAGYKSLRLGVGKHYTIHFLVASRWLPQPTIPNCEIDHIDRNKLNNHASNLRWVSKKENMNNKNIETKARKTNLLQEHHIRVSMTKGQKTPTYVVVFNTKSIKHYSIHKTLDDAIQKRNLIIEHKDAPI